MVEIEWHPRALDDLQKIYYFISRDSVYYAKVIIQNIRNKVKNLSSFPKMGRKVPEYNKDNIRELILQYYRVIYHLRADSILIIGIFHSRQQIDLEGEI